jgi:hypothetical protein
MVTTGLRLDLLPEPLALLQLPAGAPVPQWAEEARHFLAITRTPSELSIVADSAAVPGDIVADRAYRAFRVRGPLPLNLVGVFATLAGPLAAAAIPIFPIATYETDYVLVKEEDIQRARDTLTAAGHHVAS